MAVETIRVDGLQELEAKLQRLPERLAVKVIAAGLRVGARLTLAQAKRNAKRPGGTGTLARGYVLARDRQSKPMAPMYSIYARRGKSYQAGMRRGRVGTNRKANKSNMDAFYAPFVEFGTKPHDIRARKGKTLAFSGNGGMTFRRAVKHPGAKAIAPLGNAFGATRDRALEAAKNYIAQRIEREAEAA